MTNSRNIVAVIAGLAIGAIFNMAIVIIGPSLIPPPEGIDVNNMESMSANIHLFEPKHFVAPFLAHALGTLAGSIAAYLIASSAKELLAYVIGAFFFAGGITASFMIPAPTWFIALDLIAAYLPMAWLAIVISTRLSRKI